MRHDYCTPWPHPIKEGLCFSPPHPIKGGLCCSLPHPIKGGLCCSPPHSIKGGLCCSPAPPHQGGFVLSLTPPHQGGFVPHPIQSSCFIYSANCLTHWQLLTNGTKCINLSSYSNIRTYFHFQTSYMKIMKKKEQAGFWIMCFIQLTKCLSLGVCSLNTAQGVFDPINGVSPHWWGLIAHSFWELISIFKIHNPSNGWVLSSSCFKLILFVNQSGGWDICVWAQRGKVTNASSVRWRSSIIK